MLMCSHSVDLDLCATQTVHASYLKLAAGIYPAQSFLDDAVNSHCARHAINPSLSVQRGAAALCPIIVIDSDCSCMLASYWYLSISALSASTQVPTRWCCWGLAKVDSCRPHRCSGVPPMLTMHGCGVLVLIYAAGAVCTLRTTVKRMTVV